MIKYLKYQSNLKLLEAVAIEVLDRIDLSANNVLCPGDRVSVVLDQSQLDSMTGMDVLNIQSELRAASKSLRCGYVEVLPKEDNSNCYTIRMRRKSK
jgi:hypothetical protein